MPAFTIQKATSKEQMIEVARLFKSTRIQCLPYLPELHTEAEDIEHFSNKVFSECEVHLAINPNSRLIGFIAFRKDWVDHLYIAPESHGLGIGSQLLALAQAKSNDLQLWAFKQNTKAQAFYRKHGFVLVKETDGSGNEERMPDVLMQWQRQ